MTNTAGLLILFGLFSLMFIAGLVLIHRSSRRDELSQELARGYREGYRAARNNEPPKDFP